MMGGEYAATGTALPPSRLYVEEPPLNDISGRLMAFSVASSPSVVQPFTTPGPHASQGSVSREGKNVHFRFLPQAFYSSPVITIKRPRSSPRMGSIDIEPIPFSKPYIQTAETLALKNRYTGQRRRELCLQSAINLPTIEETSGESWYTSPSPPLQARAISAEEYSEPHAFLEGSNPVENLQHNMTMTEEATESWQPYQYYVKAQLPPTEGMYDKTNFQTEFLSPPGSAARLTERTNVYSGKHLESSGPLTDEGSGHGPWMTRQQLLAEPHVARDLYHRSSSGHGDAEQFYAYSGKDVQEVGYSSDCQTDTAVMDIEVLEAIAAAAATSEGSITAVNNFADGSCDGGLSPKDVHSHEEMAGEVSSFL